MRVKNLIFSVFLFFSFSFGMAQIRCSHKIITVENSQTEKKIETLQDYFYNIYAISSRSFHNGGNPIGDKAKFILCDNSNSENQTKSIIDFKNIKMADIEVLKFHYEKNDSLPYGEYGELFGIICLDKLKLKR